MALAANPESVVQRMTFATISDNHPVYWRGPVSGINKRERGHLGLVKLTRPDACPRPSPDRDNNTFHPAHSPGNSTPTPGEAHRKRPGARISPSHGMGYLVMIGMGQADGSKPPQLAFTLVLGHRNVG